MNRFPTLGSFLTRCAGRVVPYAALLGVACLLISPSVRSDDNLTRLRDRRVREHRPIAMTGVALQLWLAELERQGVIPHLLSRDQATKLAGDKAAFDALMETLIFAQQMNLLQDSHTQAEVNRFIETRDYAILRNLRRWLVIGGLQLPEEAASSKLTTGQLLDLVATASLLGDKPGENDVHSPKFWAEVKQKGVNAVLKGKIRATWNIPASETKGLSPRQLLRGVVNAERLNVATNSKGFWKNYTSRVKGGNGSGGNGGNNGNGGGNGSGTGTGSPNANRPDGGNGNGNNENEPSSTNPSNPNPAGTTPAGTTPGNSPTGSPSNGSITFSLVSGGKGQAGTATITYNTPAGQETYTVTFDAEGNGVAKDAAGNTVGPVHVDIPDGAKPGDSSTVPIEAGDNPGGTTFPTGNEGGQGGPSNGNGAGNNPGSNGGSNSGSGGDTASNDDGDDGDDPDGDDAAEDETAVAESDTEEDSSGEEDTETYVDPSKDDSRPAIPLFMLVRGAMGHQDETRTRRLLEGRRGGGVTDPNPLADGSRAGAVLLDRYQFRLIALAIADGLGGGFTDPNPMSDPDRGGAVFDPRAVMKNNVGVDAPDRFAPKAPVDPTNVPRGGPVGPSPVSRTRLSVSLVAGAPPSGLPPALSASLAQHLAGQPAVLAASGTTQIEVTLKDGRLIGATVTGSAAGKGAQVDRTVLAAVQKWSVPRGATGTWRLKIQIKGK